MIKVTRELLRGANSCYGAARENELILENGLSIREVAALDIPVRDKIWAICYASNAPDNALREFACWCARNALNAERKAGREPDPRSWAAVDIAERHARGEASKAELDAASGNAWKAYFAAYNAACYAAYVAACYASNAASHAAYFAASDAASDAARSAAYLASNAAAYYTACDAPSDSACSAIRRWQLKKLVDLLS